MEQLISEQKRRKETLKKMGFKNPKLASNEFYQEFKHHQEIIISEMFQNIPALKNLEIKKNFNVFFIKKINEFEIDIIYSLMKSAKTTSEFKSLLIEINISEKEMSLIQEVVDVCFWINDSLDSNVILNRNLE